MAESPYSVRQEEEEGYPIYLLEDAAAGSRAWVSPAHGLNAYRFTITMDGRLVNVLHPPPSLADLREHPSWFGLPILFPFPGRIRHGRFTFGGRSYGLQKVNPDGHASHGFVLDRHWRAIAGRSSRDGGAAVVARFASREFPELAAQYPSAFRLEVTHRLRGWTLAVEARAENVGQEPLPAGYGLHPYLRAPIADLSSAGHCTIRVPVARRWELADMIPTGRLLPEQDNLARGISLAGRRFDDVYTGVQLTRGGSRCELQDEVAGLAVAVEADPGFREWVVYTPPRPAVSLEPYTCAPDAINLEERGVDAGLVVLQPGEARTWTVRLVAQQLRPAPQLPGCGPVQELVERG